MFAEFIPIHLSNAKQSCIAIIVTISDILLIIHSLIFYISTQNQRKIMPRNRTKFNIISNWLLLISNNKAKYTQKRKYYVINELFASFNKEVGSNDVITLRSFKVNLNKCLCSQNTDYKLCRISTDVRYEYKYIILSINDDFSESIRVSPRKLGSISSTSSPNWKPMEY